MRLRLRLRACSHVEPLGCRTSHGVVEVDPAYVAQFLESLTAEADLEPDVLAVSDRSTVLDVQVKQQDVAPILGMCQ